MSAGQPSQLALLLAYAQCATRPRDAARFRSLAGAGGRLGPMTAAAFLLHDFAEASKTSLHGFIFDTAPILLQQLSRDTRRVRVTYHGRVQGRIDWPGTQKARLSGDSDPTQFVCRQTERAFDRPENRLLKFLLDRVQKCLDSARPALHDWHAWGRVCRQLPGEPVDLDAYFDGLGHRVRILNAHICLRDVHLPTAVQSRHLAAARSAKDRRYAIVADLVELYQSLVGAPDWDAWVYNLGATLPLPRGAEAFATHLVL